MLTTELQAELDKLNDKAIKLHLQLDINDNPELAELLIQTGALAAEVKTKRKTVNTHLTSATDVEHAMVTAIESSLAQLRTRQRAISKTVRNVGLLTKRLNVIGTLEEEIQEGVGKIAEKMGVPRTKILENYPYLATKNL